jgi:hypothetical protein
MKNNFSTYSSSLLAPPGAGAFTVSTGSEEKQLLWQSLYGTKDAAKVTKKFLKNSVAPKAQNSFALLGMPFDTGAAIQRGSNWGPLYLRHALLEHAPHLLLKNAWDIGDIKVIAALLDDSLLKLLKRAGCYSITLGIESGSDKILRDMKNPQMWFLLYYESLPIASIMESKRLMWVRWNESLDDWESPSSGMLQSVPEDRVKTYHPDYPDQSYL